MDQFATAFTDADSVFVLDIYPASEQPIPGVTGEALAQQVIKLGGKTAVYLGSSAEAASAAAAVAEEKDLILTLGAGNISQLGPQILQQLQGRPHAVKITAG